MPTTLYDIMEDVYDRKTRPKREQKDVAVEYYTHIYPVLLSAYTLSWTHNQAFEGHGMCLDSLLYIFPNGQL
jgi:hypothetical protein